MPSSAEMSVASASTAPESASPTPSTTTGNVSAVLPLKPSRSCSLATRDGADSGSTRSSGAPNATPRNGEPRNSNTATTLTATSNGRRMTRFAVRYQKPSCSALRGRWGSTRRASMRVPTTLNSAGRATIEATIASSTTAMPA